MTLSRNPSIKDKENDETEGRRGGNECEVQTDGPKGKGPSEKIKKGGPSLKEKRLKHQNIIHG